MGQDAVVGGDGVGGVGGAVGPQDAQRELLHPLGVRLQPVSLGRRGKASPPPPQEGLASSKLANTRAGGQLLYGWVWIPVVGG